MRWDCNEAEQSIPELLKPHGPSASVKPRDRQNSSVPRAQRKLCSSARRRRPPSGARVYPISNRAHRSRTELSATAAATVRGNTKIAAGDKAPNCAPGAVNSRPRDPNSRTCDHKSAPRCRSRRKRKIAQNQRVAGGAEGIRTPDLCSAIAALSHLSYSPVARAVYVRPSFVSTVRAGQDATSYPRGVLETHASAD